MPKCPACRTTFSVLEDENDGQHECPSCGYGTRCVVCERLEDECECHPADQPRDEATCGMCGERDDDCRCYDGDDVDPDNEENAE